MSFVLIALLLTTLSLINTSGGLLGGPSPLQLPDDSLYTALNAVKNDFITLANSQNMEINTSIKQFFKPRKAYQQVVAGLIYYVSVRITKNKFAHIKIFKDLSNPPKYQISDAFFNKKRYNSLLASFINICEQPKKVGPCRAAFVKYYYDTVTKTCQDFVYGGCQGNQNNFRTIKQCTKTCVNTNGDSTKPISNTNNNENINKIKNKADICNLPKVHGTCNKSGFKYRYYYNKLTNKCQRFKYSGCDGNANNFKTKKQCSSICVE